MIRKRKIIKYGSEADIQAAVIRYLKIAMPKVLFCASAGGLKTSMTQAIRMKMTGYVKGFPDLQICEPRGKYHGLFIELKKESGVTSKEQKEWIKKLNDRGYLATVCFSSEGAIRVINEYINDGSPSDY